MTFANVFITGIGIISPVGTGVQENLEAIRTAKSGLRPLSLFPVANPFPAGEIHPDPGLGLDPDLPRTHALALRAAREALARENTPPDAIVIGVTTGGMPKTELLLREKNPHPDAYRWHGAGTVATCLARELKCPGPAFTISTACSSGAAALIFGLALIRSGIALRVLAGGADGLCRFTYFGFNSLQLLDPQGARPLDKNRAGMSLGEGAAMLLLVGAGPAPENAIARLAGGGLSCDAYHATAPRPDGAGAFTAMREAIIDAGLAIEDIDYINLHGTGTIDNDAAETTAIKKLFGKTIPELSSLKGMTGHSLGAAGAIDAAVCALGLEQGIVPANAGFREADPRIGISPRPQPHFRPLHRLLSNSFGFGGNNAALVITAPGETTSASRNFALPALRVRGSSCLTGAGGINPTLDKFISGNSAAGMLRDEEIVKDLPVRAIRRLKRLPRLALSLAAAAQLDAALKENPAAVFFGTAWGPLSETYDFLMKLFETKESSSSPTDFIGSVHNAPAGQVALWFQATGANLTAACGDYSFEQALLMASLFSPAGKFSIVLGAEETHPLFSPRLDASVAGDAVASDGGGALIVTPAEAESGTRMKSLFFSSGHNAGAAMASLVSALGGLEIIRGKYGVLFAGIPGADDARAREQMNIFLSLTGFPGPVIDYRRYTGQYAAAAAIASVLAVRLIANGKIPRSLTGAEDLVLEKKGILILGLGPQITAMEARG
ncbi:MAG: beta-ketoacyl synthase N-terminal-like domain-containing protein [Proteobacteria bacterium]|nr:beta-ketoacyl synthase N-terminal-like domain-containing protein [Pseudomonadota bacterium]